MLTRNDTNKNRLWQKRQKGQNILQDKEDSYPRFPKLHLTCSRCWTAHEDTKLWRKMPNQPVAADFNQSITKGVPTFSPPPGVHLSFSAIVLKVWRVELQFPILQGIPVGYSKHSRCLKKSFVNLEPGWEVFISSDTLASLRNQIPPLNKTTNFADILSRRKIELKDVQNNSMVPKSKLWAHKAVSWFSKTEWIRLPGNSLAC